MLIAITDNPAHDIPMILGMDFKLINYWAVKHPHATYLWVTKVVVDDYDYYHRIMILRRLCLRTGTATSTKQSENPIIVTSRVSHF